MPIQDGSFVRKPKFTLVVPSNDAWEMAQMNFNQAYNTLQDGQFPQYVSIFYTFPQNPSRFNFEAIHKRKVDISHTLDNLKVGMFTFALATKTQYSQPCQFGLILA